MANKITIIILGLAAIGAAALLWMTLCGDPLPVGKPVQAKKTHVQEATPAVKVAPKPAANKKAEKKVVQKVERKKKKAKRAFGRSSAVDTYSPEDRKLADAVQAGLDDDDFEQTRKAAAEAMKSENPDVRQEAVEALGWFEDKALVDLTRAMADKNADVAESARGHVENALMGMEDDDRAVALASEYVKLFADDEDAVTMFAGVLSSAGSRIIDPDDSDSAEDVAKAKENRAGIVGIVAEMIDKGGKLAEKGKELYEEISGDEWAGRAAADKWADDIEEPEPEESKPEESESSEPEESESTES